MKQQNYALQTCAIQATIMGTSCIALVQTAAGCLGANGRACKQVYSAHAGCICSCDGQNNYGLGLQLQLLNVALCMHQNGNSRIIV